MPLYMVTVNRQLVVEAESPARAVGVASEESLHAWDDVDMYVQPVRENGPAGSRYRASQLAAEAPATRR